MARLDRLKEEIGYLKFWPGVVVITDITLVGWLVSTFDTVAGLRRMDEIRNVINMETLVTIVAFAALMVIFGVAMHAALRK